MQVNEKTGNCLISWVVFICLVGCSNRADDTASTAFSMRLERDTRSSPYPILIRIQAPKGSMVHITSSSGKLGAIEEVSGEHRATLTPSYPSGEIIISASSEIDNKTVQISKTAIVVPGIHPRWGQPQAVEGLVNTLGYEDGAEISPDGELLIVSSYSPVDMACCITGCGLETPMDPSSQYCQSALGPFQGPYRPEMPGAGRILSQNRILNSCPELCVTSETNYFFLIPSASYLFRRQADGTFGNPQVIGIDAGGCLPTQGYSFIKTPLDRLPEVIFSFDAPGEMLEHDIYHAIIQPNQKNYFARYYCAAGNIALDLTSIKAVEVGSSLVGDKGNPNVDSGLLFWDSEKESPNSLNYSSLSGELPAATYSDKLPVAVGNMTADRRQPYLYQSRLYFAQAEAGSRIVSAKMLSPEAHRPEAWSAVQYELTPEPNLGPLLNRNGAIVEIGEPSISNHPEDGERLYFVYYVWTGNGFNSQVGYVEAVK